MLTSYRITTFAILGNAVLCYVYDMANFVLFVLLSAGRRSYLNYSLTYFFVQILTWIMKETLGGNCETLMLCCITECEKSVQETVNCLKYGSMVRNVINKPVINEVSEHICKASRDLS